MTKKEQSYKLIREYLDELESDISYELAVDESNSFELEYGWFFRFDARIYLETKDEDYALCGQKPLIVDLEFSEITRVVTKRSIELELAIYKWKRRKRKLIKFIRSM